MMEKSKNADDIKDKAKDKTDGKVIGNKKMQAKGKTRSAKGGTKGDIKKKGKYLED